MAAIRIDAGGWPIVVITYDGIVSDAEFDAFLARAAQLYHAREPFVSVLDATRAGITPESQIKRQAAWLTEHKLTLKHYSLGFAFVFASPVFRFVLSSIFLIQPLPCKYTVCSTVESGVAWGRLQVQAWQRQAAVG